MPTSGSGALERGKRFKRAACLTLHGRSWGIRLLEKVGKNGLGVGALDNNV